MNERLEYLRKESKITQNQLARFLSVDPRHDYKIREWN